MNTSSYTQSYSILVPKLLRLFGALMLAFFIGFLVSGAHADPPKSKESRVALWVYEASLTWIPLWSVNGWETKDQADVRRLSIANDIIAVSFDASENPAFNSSDGDYVSRVNTAIFLASIASYEAGYDVRIDLGHCEAMPGGIKAGWCDRGSSHSMWQINIGNGKTADGWVKADLIADRKKAVRAALRALRESVKACGKQYSGADAFSWYAQGSCGQSAKMRERLGRAVEWTKAHPAPKA